MGDEKTNVKSNGQIIWNSIYYIIDQYVLFHGKAAAKCFLENKKKKKWRDRLKIENLTIKGGKEDAEESRRKAEEEENVHDENHHIDEAFPIPLQE